MIDIKHTVEMFIHKDPRKMYFFIGYKTVCIIYDDILNQ